MSKVLRSYYRKIFRKKAPKIGAILIGAILLFVLIAALVSPYSANAPSGKPDSPPNASHLFGTDYLGNDLLTQVAWGAIPSLLVGVGAAILAIIFGLTVGVFGGYFRKLESVLAGSTDVMLTFPSLVLLLIIGSLVVVNDTVIMSALVLVLWATIARGIRAQVASLKQRPYVEAAKVGGLSDRKVIGQIIIPEIIPIAVAYFIISLSTAIILVTALEFLGVGNPQEVSWGSILFYAQQYGFYQGDWWWVLAPGLAVTFVSAGFALIGFSFEEIMNPRLRV